MCVNDQGTVNVTVMYTTCGRQAIGGAVMSLHNGRLWRFIALDTLMYVLHFVKPSRVLVCIMADPTIISS